jgi:hypothetical protein
MAEDGSRIPAWRRLGLALKNEIQSGVAAPEPSVAQSEPQRNSPYDGHNGSHQVSIEPAVNEKLGKRKHQHEPADEAGQTAKRGKTSTTETHSIESIANDAPFVAEVAAVNVQTALAEPSTSEAPQPKGDPNYRKKKAKPNKNKRRIQYRQKQITTVHLSHLAQPCQIKDDGLYLRPLSWIISLWREHLHPRDIVKPARTATTPQALLPGLIAESQLRLLPIRRE